MHCVQTCKRNQRTGVPRHQAVLNMEDGQDAGLGLFPDQKLESQPGGSVLFGDVVACRMAGRRVIVASLSKGITAAVSVLDVSRSDLNR